MIIKSGLLLITAIGCACGSGNRGMDSNIVAEITAVQRILTCTQSDKKCNLKLYVFQERAGVNEESLHKDAEFLHYLTKTYYYPNINEFVVEYDTMNDIVRSLNIIVSFKNSKTDTAIIANALFGFDYTKKYLPDTVL